MYIHCYFSAFSNFCVCLSAREWNPGAGTQLCALYVHTGFLYNINIHCMDNSCMDSSCMDNSCLAILTLPTVTMAAKGCGSTQMYSTVARTGWLYGKGSPKPNNVVVADWSGQHTNSAKLAPRKLNSQSDYVLGAKRQLWQKESRSMKLHGAAESIRGRQTVRDAIATK